MAPAVLNRVRHNFSAVDPGLTTPEMPVFRARSKTELVSRNRPARMQSWKAFTGLAAIVVVLTASALAQPWKSHPSKLGAAGSSAADSLRMVNIDRPAPAARASVVLPATIRPWQITMLYARVSGYLGAWHNEIGTQVKAGDLLAEIETPELDQELVQAGALVLEAEAAVVQARAERAEAQADLKVAEAQLDRVQSDTALARSQLVRREKLLANRAVSLEEFETSSRQVEARTADVAAAESDIVRRRTNLETRAAIIEVREATAKSRRADVERLNELQTFKRIVAPFDGVVTRRAAEVGMLVTAGKEALFVVEDMRRVRVQLNVPQTYASETSPGIAASINLPESTGKAVAAMITRVAESVDSTNRTMLAEIELDNAAVRFQPGSYAQVTLTTKQDDSAWTIPANTLSMRVEGPHVAVVNDDDQIEIRPVRLGRDLGKRVVVVDGIRGDERLVVNPADDLVSGIRIQIGNSREGNHEVAQK